MTDQTKSNDEPGKSDAGNDAKAKPAAKAAERKDSGEVTKPGPMPEKRPGRVGGRRILRVVAKQPTRWRIGRRFGADPVEIDADDLDEAQLTALAADPLLVVSGHLTPEEA